MCLHILKLLCLDNLLIYFYFTSFLLLSLFICLYLFFFFTENPLLCGCEIAWIVLNEDYRNLFTDTSKCVNGEMVIFLDPLMYATLCRSLAWAKEGWLVSGNWERLMSSLFLQFYMLLNLFYQSHFIFFFSICLG